ncbi:hypothetical protein DFH09DRAFT_1094097 [Mycena vulgaris]|nr:hypothetical protein DFH09DRAFT_1094097 [Mycena vulgaris]
MNSCRPGIWASANGFGAMVGGIIAYGMGQVDTGISGWKWIYGAAFSTLLPTRALLTERQSSTVLLPFCGNNPESVTDWPTIELYFYRGFSEDHYLFTDRRWAKCKVVKVTDDF